MSIYWDDKEKTLEYEVDVENSLDAWLESQNKLEEEIQDMQKDGWYYGTIADFSDLIEEEGLKKVFDDLPEHIQKEFRDLLCP